VCDVDGDADGEYATARTDRFRDPLGEGSDTEYPHDPRRRDVLVLTNDHLKDPGGLDEEQCGLCEVGCGGDLGAAPST
jgi:hypothetical protein